MNAVLRHLHVFLLALPAALQEPAPKAAAAPEEPAEGAGIRIEIPAESQAGGFVLKSPLLPGEKLELSSCEALLDGNADLGMYTVVTRPEDWKIEGGEHRYRWSFEQGLRLEFLARPGKDYVDLAYSLENASKKSFARLHLHPCLPTVGAPSFYPGTPEQAVAGGGGRAARVGKRDYGELYRRLFLWSKGRSFSFFETELGPSEKHLAFARKGEDPIEWNWWRNGEETFDVPLIALGSKDGRRTLALGFEEAVWASSNVGDSRACLHLFPLFGRLKPGQTKVVRGRLYLIEGAPKDALERFRKDFAKTP